MAVGPYPVLLLNIPQMTKLVCVGNFTYHIFFWLVNVGPWPYEYNQYKL